MCIRVHATPLGFSVSDYFLNKCFHIVASGLPSLKENNFFLFRFKSYTLELFYQSGLFMPTLRTRNWDPTHLNHLDREEKVVSVGGEGISKGAFICCYQGKRKANN